MSTKSTTSLEGEPQVEMWLNLGAAALQLAAAALTAASALRPSDKDRCRASRGKETARSKIEISRLKMNEQRYEPLAVPNSHGQTAVVDQ